MQACEDKLAYTPAPLEHADWALTGAQLIWKHQPMLISQLALS